MISLGLDKLEPTTTLIPRKTIMEQMGVPSSTFHDWVKSYGLPTIKVKRRVFVTQSDWTEWIEKHRR